MGIRIVTVVLSCFLCGCTIAPNRFEDSVLMSFDNLRWQGRLVLSLRNETDRIWSMGLDQGGRWSAVCREGFDGYCLEITGLFSVYMPRYLASAPVVGDDWSNGNSQFYLVDIQPTAKTDSGDVFFVYSIQEDQGIVFLIEEGFGLVGFYTLADNHGRSENHETFALESCIQSAWLVDKSGSIASW